MIEYRIRDTSTMLKLFYVIFMNLHRAPYMIPRMRAEADHPQRYTEEQRYSLVQHAIYLMNKTGKINTVETGAENLPKQGGYMMYPNHQGKYDVLGIMYTHKSPCSFVMDKRKSHTILVREFCDLVQAKRLEKDNPRQGITIINQVAKEVAAGKKYILFPEGGYRFNNKNKVCDFKAGSFKIALKSHAPIVPIALIDSYKVFNSFHIGPITTYVHYLKPICYEEYKGMKTQEIADLVKIRIEEKNTTGNAGTQVKKFPVSFFNGYRNFYILITYNHHDRLRNPRRYFLWYIPVFDLAVFQPAQRAVLLHP